MNRFVLIRNAIVESGYADKLTIKEANDLATYLVDCLTDEIEKEWFESAKALAGKG